MRTITDILIEVQSLKDEIQKRKVEIKNIIVEVIRECAENQPKDERFKSSGELLNVVNYSKMDNWSIMYHNWLKTVPAVIDYLYDNNSAQWKLSLKRLIRKFPNTDSVLLNCYIDGYKGEETIVDKKFLTAIINKL